MQRSIALQIESFVVCCALCAPIPRLMLLKILVAQYSVFYFDLFFTTAGLNFSQTLLTFCLMMPIVVDLPLILLQLDHWKRFMVNGLHGYANWAGTKARAACPVRDAKRNCWRKLRVLCPAALIDVLYYSAKTHCATMLLSTLDKLNIGSRLYPVLVPVFI